MSLTYPQRELPRLIGAGMLPSEGFGDQSEQLFNTWLSEHAETAEQLRTDAVSLGCGALCLSLDEPVSSELRSRSESGSLLLGGRILPLAHTEDMPILERISAYASLAFKHRERGMQFLLLDGMSSISETRAAVLGARQSHLPILVVVETDSEGLCPDDSDLLAMMASVQHLGASAMGIHCSGDRISTLQLIGRIYPLAQLPLIARLSLSGYTPEIPQGYSIAPDEYGDYATQSLRAGAQLFVADYNAPAEYISSLAESLASFSHGDRVLERDEETLLMASGRDAFYLSPDQLTFSETITCHYDMSADILAAEEHGCDVLKIEVNTLDDAADFAANAHMIKLPVCISSHSEEALELALLAFDGRAFVDILTEADSENVTQLAKGYGAVVL